MISNKGINRRRLPQNPMEQIFADEWEKMAPNILGWIIPSDYTEKDAIIVATMMQWLGSPVGQRFLEQVQKKFNFYNINKS